MVGLYGVLEGAGFQDGRSHEGQEVRGMTLSLKEKLPAVAELPFFPE